MRTWSRARLLDCGCDSVLEDYTEGVAQHWMLTLRTWSRAG